MLDVLPLPVTPVAEPKFAVTGDYDDKPFVDFDVFGMPPPGDDFVAHAESLATEPGEVPTLLNRLHRQALYDSKFHLPVKVKGKLKNARFVPGHTWDPQFGVGPDLSIPIDVMVVGKCPGAEEDRLGLNMVGKNGHMFAKILTEVGVPKSVFARWYMTSLVRYAPLDNSTRLPSYSIRNCQPLLEMEIRLLRPKFVLCLGSEASVWMVGEKIAGGATSLHGRVMQRRVPLHREGEDPSWHEFYFITCVQPAAVSKTPDRLPELKTTLLRFSQLLSGEMPVEDSYHTLDHRVIYSVEHLRQEVDKVIDEHRKTGLPSQPVAIDCEWSGNYWSACGVPVGDTLPDGRKTSAAKRETVSWLRTIQFSHKPGFARTVVLRHGGARSPDGNDEVGVSAFVPSISDAVTELKRLLTSTPERHVRVVGHNLKADLPWLLKLDPELGNTVVAGFEPPLDDPDPDGVNRLFGWQKFMRFGGFDTLYGIHACQETADRKLEIAAMNLCGLRRYDGDVQKEKKQLCSQLGVSGKKLPGYGEISDDALHRYGNFDADATIRLFVALTKPGGLLDKDQYGNYSWLPCWLSQSKLTAELEMEMEGMMISRKRADKLTGIYAEAYGRLLADLQRQIGWEPVYDGDELIETGFNPRSVFQTRCVLFGPEFSGKFDKDTGAVVDPRPESAKDCLILGLMPIKTTGKPSKSWDKVVAKNQTAEYSPSTDKESLGILFARAALSGDSQAADVLQTLRWYRFINRVITGVLCPPDDDSEGYFNEDGEIVYEKGVMAAVEVDGKVRSHYLPVDTGRVSSTSINVQNFSKRRESDMKQILGTGYAFPLRSIVVSEDGWVFDESDFIGAELLMMAIQSGSEKMVDHCKRASLPESDPRHYDIHARLSKIAFNFECEPTKGAMEKAGILHLRDITKTLVFGKPYGRGDEAVIRAIEETGTKTSMTEVAKINQAIFGEYPELEPFFAACRARVTRPGWIRTCFGRYRRFQVVDEDSIPDLERIAGNLPIQGGVADCTSLSIGLLKRHPDRYDQNGKPRYLLKAQIHDAVLSAVRVDSVRLYREKILPDCMRHGYQVFACDLNGDRLPNRPGYHMDYDSTLYKHWGVKLSREEGLELGVDPEFLPKPKKV